MSNVPSSSGSSAAELKNTHAVARRLLLELRTLLERLERLDASATATLVAEAQRKAQDLGRTSAALDAQARAASLRGGSSGAGDLWTRKAQAVAEDGAQLAASLERVVSARSAAAVEARARSELFHRTSGAVPGGGERSGAASFDAEAQDAQASQAAFASARRGNAALEELGDVAVAVLGALASQRETLKSAQRRALDVLNTVGVSTSLLGRAERRQRGDRALVAGCSAAVLLVFVGLLYVTRRT